MKKVYLIHGVLFQRNTRFALGEKPGIGTAVKLVKRDEFAIFAGVVGEIGVGIYQGEMTDVWGFSEISDFEIINDKLFFKKVYVSPDGRRRPPILYTFTKQKDESWEGTYEGDDCGKGTARCFLQETTEEYFNPPGE